jgi:hypothetical protein
MCTNLTDISSMDSDDRLGEIRGLLIQMELLATQWNIIKPEKYNYRLNQDGFYFDINSIQLAFKRIVLQTQNN